MKKKRSGQKSRQTVSKQKFMRRRQRNRDNSDLNIDRLEPRYLLAASPSFVPNELLVQFLPDTPMVERDAVRGIANATLTNEIHTRTMRATNTGVLERIHLPDNMPVHAAMNMLAGNPFVVAAEPNWIHTAASVSNDPYYTNGTLWGMNSNDTPTAIGPSGTTNAYGIQAEKAWNDGMTGSSSVVVGVIDEGFQYNHPDLINNVWVNPGEIAGDGIDNDGNGYVDDIHGWDFYNDDNTVYDGTGDDHGTHVAGTIGGQGGNGIGVAGVNWDVTMISAKFLGPTSGSTAGAIAAVDYLTDLKVNYGVNVVASNNSWGGGGYSSLLEAAITRGANADILFISAAGNANANNDSGGYYPANYNTTAGAGYDAVVSVASITSSGARSSFSSYGATTVDIGAPGSSITSTLPADTYGSYSGTSMATPHVAGAVALYASQFPNATGQEIREAILSSATPTPSLAGLTVTGGRLDVYAALMSGNPPGVQVNLDAVDADLDEGDSGVTQFTFEISLDEPASSATPVDVTWAVDLANSDVDASDFVAGSAMSGTVTFSDPQNPNALTQTLTLSVQGDLTVEAAEAFEVAILSTSLGELGRDRAVGTILGDDGQIDGTVWNDLNQSGSQDSGDTPAAGVSIYIDGNNDGQFNPGESQQITDGNGGYSFPVNPGSYTLRLDLTANQDQTFPTIVAGTLDPDEYSPGTVLNNVLAPNVVLSGVGASVTNSDVTALSTSFNSTGSLSFGSSWGSGYWNTDDADLRVDFANNASSVSIDFISDDSSDYGHLRAYSSAGVLLDEYVTQNLGTGVVETMTISRTGNDIAYVLASGQNGQFGYLDNLAFAAADDGNAAPLNVTVGAEIVTQNDFGVFQTIPNDPPIADDDNLTIAEDSVATTIDVLAGDFDPDGDDLTIVSISNASNGTANIASDGLSVSYTPNPNYNGSDSFTYTVSDGNGGSDTATVNITITSVNDNPVAENDTETVLQNSTNTVFDVLGNDTDLDGDSLVISAVQYNGTGIVVNNGNSLTYTPDVDFTGNESIVYTVSDGAGGTDSATVNVTVNEVNQNPIANDDNESLLEDSGPATINVLANDTDGNGDSLTITSVSYSGDGTVTHDGVNISYTPLLNFNGSETFTYSISDGKDGSDTATVTVDVTPVNDAPVASNDNGSTLAGNAVTIDVLTNDSDVDAGDVLSISSVSNPNNGTATINGNQIVYTPNQNYSGSDTFTYLVSDTAGETDTATVNVDVSPVVVRAYADLNYANGMIYGTVIDGSIIDTHQAGAGQQILTEVAIDVDPGKKTKLGSALEYHWAFPGLDGATSFNVAANQFSNADDNFRFEYSVDNGGNWTTLGTINQTTSYQNITVDNLSITGDVLVRVIDTDRSPANRRSTPNLDSIVIDHLYFETAPADLREKISVVATAPDAVENIANSGEFTISRETTEGDMTVFYTVSGSATSSTDFVALSGIAVIPSGSSSISIAVNPIDDATSEGSETVVLSLTEDANYDYQVGSSDSATVTIADDDIPPYTYASSESTVKGSVIQNSYLQTQGDDNVVETIEERREGKGRRRVTLMDHRWTFSGVDSAISFHVDAARSANTEGDNFSFSYSDDGGSTWVEMVVVNSSQFNTYSVNLGSPISGDIIVRVVDTDPTTVGNGSRDTVSIDQMFFSTQPVGSSAFTLGGSTPTSGNRLDGLAGFRESLATGKTPMFSLASSNQMSKNSNSFVVAHLPDSTPLDQFWASTSSDELLGKTDDSKTEQSADLNNRTEFTDAFKSVDDAFSANLK
ncbi:tandem-95 repeat protein [bacterium]|nr:tandem-95 repeat protein [bacterium]